MMLPGASGEATMEAQISGDAPIPPTKIETKDLSGKMGLLCIVVSGKDH